MTKNDEKAERRAGPAVVLLTIAATLSVPALGQTEGEDAFRQGLRFLGVKYGSVLDQGGWAGDALSYTAPGLSEPVLSDLSSSGGLGVDAVWQIGSGASGIHATFERVVHEFAFYPDVYSWRDGEGWQGWPGVATVDADQRVFGAAYVLIHGRRSLRFYWGAGHAFSTIRTSGSVETPFSGTTPQEQARLAEALFGFVVDDSGDDPLDFLASVVTTEGYDLLAPDPPQPDGIYAVAGVLHTPRNGRFTWGGNLEYFVEPELLNVNLLLGFRF